MSKRGHRRHIRGLRKGSGAVAEGTHPDDKEYEGASETEALKTN